MNAVAATIVHVCSACHREVSEPAPPGVVLEVPGPPWWCSNPRCQNAKAAGLIFGWAMKPAGESTWLMTEHIGDVREYIDDAETEEWILKRIAFTREEWNALPEFDGW